MSPNSRTSFTTPQWVLPQPWSEFGKSKQLVTYPQDHISISPDPGQSTCSSACAPHRDACGMSGSHHRWYRPQCTGLFEKEQRYFVSKSSKHEDKILLLGKYFPPLVQLTETDLDKLHSRQMEPLWYLRSSQTSAAYTPLLLSSFISSVQISTTCRKTLGRMQSKVVCISQAPGLPGCCLWQIPYVKESKPAHYFFHFYLLGRSRL